eukprot:6473842-Amphidinium_carterae.1
MEDNIQARRNEDKTRRGSGSCTDRDTGVPGECARGCGSCASGLQLPKGASASQKHDQKGLEPRAPFVYSVRINVFSKMSIFWRFQVVYKFLVVWVLDISVWQVSDFSTTTGLVV